MTHHPTGEATAQTPPRVSSRDTFQALADWWHEATDAMSSPDGKFAHPAYRRVVQMGWDVLPFILEDLRDHRSHWYSALAEITNEHPEPLQGIPSRIRAERESWLRWGVERHLLAPPSA